MKSFLNVKKAIQMWTKGLRDR